MRCYTCGDRKGPYRRVNFKDLCKECAEIVESEEYKEYVKREAEVRASLPELQELDD